MTTTTAWVSRAISHSATAPSTPAIRQPSTVRHSARTGARTRTSNDSASDSESTERSHIITGKVKENAATAAAPTQRRHPAGSHAASAAARAAQHSEAMSAMASR